MTTARIAIDNLVVEHSNDHYAERPIDGFSMHAHPGELVALRGPSGSGKTTLLSVLSGMVGAVSGTVTVNGIDVLALAGRELERYRRTTIGIVFQGFNLVPSLSARENVAAPLLLAGMRHKTAVMRADDLLNEVGIRDRGHARPNSLSGGQQQRVAIARGLIGDPVVLLADEPTANLDSASADSVLTLLQRLSARGRTILISTHDDRLLPRVDRVVEMRAEGPTRPSHVKAEVTGGVHVDLGGRKTPQPLLSG